MRRELMLVSVLGSLGCTLSSLGCLVGSADELGEPNADAEADELGCEGCTCDDASPCELGLECAQVCLLPNMVLVPGGPFPRGCDSEVCFADEAPAQLIELAAFAIDLREVTVADYLACVGAQQDPCTAPAASWDGPKSFYNFGAPGREHHPINGVTWDQATYYCHRFGKRLPTEAEWEKAAGGAHGAPYPWGSTAPTCERAHLAIGGPGCGSGSTIETGQLPDGASPSGALDMAGNVAEWIHDYYTPNYYAVSPHANPTGPPSGQLRGVRGGGWMSPVGHARTSARHSGLKHSAGIGFRCARSIP